MLGRPSRRTRVGSIAASAAIAATALTGASFATAEGLTAAVVSETPQRHLDPGALPRGANPQLPYLVGDQIRDGTNRVNVAPQPSHLNLWETASGYLLLDQLRINGRTRLTAYQRDGSSDVIARGGPWLSVVVSPDKRRVAVTRSGGPSVVTIVNPTTGREIATRTFRGAEAVGVDDSKVVLNRLGDRSRVSVSWRYERDTTRRITGRAVQDTDLLQRILVFSAVGDGGGEGCARIARSYDISKTLWRACRYEPTDWSRDGDHALATWDYFDMAGTDRWLVMNGRTGAEQGRIYGRFDWVAVWEDNSHFLTMAQGDDGDRAIIRCNVRGGCERASRIWDGRINQDSYYTAPPALIAEN